jgi:preprotein translocase subunit YajC
MLGLLVSIPLLFAQAAPGPAPAPAPAPAAGSNDGFGSLLPFLGIPIIFYLIMVRPQQQQERKRREMIDALKKNDKVLTAGGIYGTVISVDPERARVVLRVDDERGVKLAFSKASIQQVVESTSEKGSEPS